MTAMRRGIVGLVMVGWPGLAMAAEPGPTCEAQLTVERAHGHLLETHRNNLERQLAVLAWKAEQLGAQVEQLAKENTELKAALPKQPPPSGTQEKKD